MSTTPREVLSKFPSQSNAVSFRKQLGFDLRAGFVPLVLLLFTKAQQLLITDDTATLHQNFWSGIAGNVAAVAFAAMIFSNRVHTSTTSKSSSIYTRRIFLFRIVVIASLLVAVSAIFFVPLYLIIEQPNSTELSALMGWSFISSSTQAILIAGCGATISALALGRKWFFLCLILLSPIISYGLRLFLFLLTHDLNAMQGQGGIVLSIGATSVCVSIVLLVFSYRQLRLMNSAGSLSAKELQTLTLRQQLFRKELQLQRTNLMFALAATLLGFIGITMSHGAGTEIMGFSTADIRVGIFSVMLAPVLTIILPIMIGSTAAASERAMGVWLWQEALPVSWRRIIWTKVLVVTGLCLAVAGVLPYLLQLRMLDEMPVRMIYRETWPFWVALLCASIGFYCGSIARDDYQGLLISIVPLTALCGVMYLADPNGLVFPFILGFDEPFIREWALAFRLILITVAFVIPGAILLKQDGQTWWRKAVGHALVICAVTFTLTLWNVLTERSLLSRSSNSQAPEILVSNNSTKSSGAKFKLLRHLKDSRNMNVSYEIINQEQTATNHEIIGILRRRNANRALWTGESSFYPFIMSAEGRAREFPSAVNHYIQAISPNGIWIIAGPGGQSSSRQSLYEPVALDKAIVAGPMGLSLPLRWLPENLRDTILNWDHIKYNEYTGYRTYAPAGPNDLTFKVGGFELVWLDGKDQLPEELWKTNFSFKGGEQGPYILQLSPVDSGATTVSAILKPVTGANRGEFAGWSRDGAEGVTEDFSWSYRRAVIDGTVQDHTVLLSELKPNSRYEDYCCGADGSYREIAAGKSSVSGTSTALLLHQAVSLPVFSDGKTTAILTPYYTYDPNKGGPNEWDKFSLIEFGLIISDASNPTRSVKVVVDNLGLPGQVKLESPNVKPGAFITGLNSNYIYGRLRPITVSAKAIALAGGDNSVMLYNSGDDWFKPDTWKVLHIAVDRHINTSLYISEGQYLLGTGSDLWVLDLQELAETLK